MVKKIEDPMLIAEMTKAGTIESDVMLFNIDSKGSAKGRLRQGRLLLKCL